MSVLGRVAAIAIVIGVAVAAPVVIIARPEVQAATETSVVVEVAARQAKVLTRKAAAESPTRTAEMAPAKAAAHVSAAEPAAHVSTAAETTTVSTPTTAGARKRVRGQSPSERGSRRQDDQGLM